MSERQSLTPAQMWTPAQAAEFLGMSEGGVRKLIIQRKLPAIRVGRYFRIHPADVKSLIQIVGAE